MLAAGQGVHVSMYVTGSRAPLIGQNTRTRGMSRLLRSGDGLEEASPASEQLVDTLIEALHQPKFLVFADPADAASVPDRWAEPQSVASR